eukprot:TRINITY_DN3106_c0_g1_i1.p1 TRINITY_DN3106_c0_g1~~TRINITY_DN3106_c0_g1_i1.p1  ORF type:complete len:302 (+),score=42.42 TRINITY_DN3106_c0_g1_i1:79-984(+)
MADAVKQQNTSKFKQQKLPAWQPILTPIPVIVTFMVIGVIFIPVGYVLFYASEQVIEVVSSPYQSCGTVCNYTFYNLNIPNPPIYIYYKLENFYQNHRRYVKSRNDAQLRGQIVNSYSDLGDCAPYASVGGSTSPNDFYLPCGLIARSLFNDTFVFSLGNSSIDLTTDGVAWPSDLDTKFNNPPKGAPGVRVIPDFKNVDFIVWMRTAALPTFRKLWRVVKQPLIGDLTVVIKNNYPVESFGGKKYIVISTTSWLGGKNPFLGYAYMVVGIICILLAIIFLLKHLISGRRQGDTSYLEWNK